MKDYLKKYKKQICLTAAVCLLGTAAFCGFHIYHHYAQVEEQTEAFEQIAEVVEEAPESEPASGDTPVSEGEDVLAKYRELYLQNEDMVGWIAIDGTKLNYPVMQTKNNPNFYLKRNFEKEYSDLGVPYIQENCDILNSDNLIIYGHHIKGGKIFGALESYKSKSFYEKHKTIHFDTLTEQAEYEIVAVFKTVAYSAEGYRYYDFVNAETEEAFAEYVAKCKELALYDTGVSAEYGDKLITLGCAVSLFGGGGNSNAYTPVSAEVEAYDPLIRQYASQHGIPEYVELIKAVMMQESGGRGNDPMQASECGYNTRYPNTPNGITDPEYSIDVGIQNLADCLNAAEVENPVDMEHIKLALQGYNFGNGYISWAKNNYGGYSYANAVEFSAIQAERLGWDSYGDTQYVAHVLRYYPYGRAFTSGGNQAIVEVALTQLGNVGGEPYWSWYGFDSRVEWCACFVSWCAEQCGYLESGIIPKYSLCSDGVNWFRNNGQWQGRDYEPTAGNLIFFDWEGDGTIDHTGIVEKSENGTVYTVEGNSGDECKQRNYPVGSSVIYGYGIPAY